MLGYQRQPNKFTTLKLWSPSSYTSPTPSNVSRLLQCAPLASTLFKIPYHFHCICLTFTLRLLRLLYSFHNATSDTLKWSLPHFPLLEGWYVCQFHTTVLIIHLTLKCCAFSVRKQEKTLMLRGKKSTSPEEILDKQKIHSRAKSSPQAPSTLRQLHFWFASRILKGVKSNQKYCSKAVGSQPIFRTSEFLGYGFQRQTSLSHQWEKERKRKNN